MTRVVDAVAIDLSPEGVPRSLAFQGKVYLVTDTPTRLEISTAAHEALTRPPLYQPGWRFQGRDSDGDTLVFDIARDQADRWILLDVYR